MTNSADIYEYTREAEKYAELNSDIAKPSDNATNVETEFVTLTEMEKRYIEEVLEYCGGKLSGKGGAAEILGLKRTTLISKMQKLGMRN